MLIATLFVSFVLPINLVSDDIVIDLFYLSDLTIMEIIPPDNTTHICKTRYPWVTDGLFVVSFFPQKTDGKRSGGDDYVFVTRNNELVIKALEAQIERERAPKPQGQAGDLAETTYVIRNGYVFWSRNNDNLKLFSEYKSKLDYTKYESLITDLYDELKNREYDTVSLTGNRLPEIDTKGKSENFSGHNNAAIDCLIYRNESGVNLIDSVAIFMTNEDAKLFFDQMSESMKKELNNADNRSRKFSMGLENFDVSGNIVSYRIVRERR